MSNPLHNTTYNEFNKKHHRFNDGIIDDEIADNIQKIIIEEIPINNIDDIANEIAKIANVSKDLGYRLEKENRDMTK